MQITIDPRAAEPVSEQIAQGIRFAVATGRIAPGERLASVRGLARDLLVNPNTVAKVYRDLEREGVLVTKPGSGAFVAPRARSLCRKRSVAAVRKAVHSAVAKGISAGLTAGEIESLVIESIENAEVTEDAAC